MTPILEVRNLCHTYSAGTPFWRDALKDVSFSLDRGEILALIGHTGSGKSTLIQHLNGLIKPTSGEILLDGHNIWENAAFTRSVRFRVGLVFQYPEYQLFDETVYADIAFGPKNMGCDKAEIDRRVRQAAETVQLTEEDLAQSPFSLSGGQKRRAAIAGVLAMEPEILILDEPTAGLDPAGSRRILKNVLDYRERTGAAVIMVSHSMDEAANYADRLLVLSEGECVLQGTPKEVFSDVKKLTEISLDIPEITKVLLGLRERGIDVDCAAFTVEEAVQAIRKVRGDRV